MQMRIDRITIRRMNTKVLTVSDESIPRAAWPASRTAGVMRAVRPTPPAAEMPRWTSEALLHGGHQAEIAHGDQVYRLRLTSLGKLILTK